MVYIHLITSKTKANSFVYKPILPWPKKYYPLLPYSKTREKDDIHGSSTNKGNTTPSPADEILKYKELMDQGIITQEEFEAKKKQLLGL